jgi:phosphoglycolate phosphatase-like HAD superfamily hydrolase
VAYADKLLRRLTRKGMPLAIVSNKDATGAETLLTTLGWRSMFKTVIGHGTPGAGVKPDAQPTLLALSRLGVAAEDAAFVGDSPSDMTSGAKAGLRLRVGLLTPVRTAEELQAAGATHVTRTLRQVQKLLLNPPLAR